MISEARVRSGEGGSNTLPGRSLVQSAQLVPPLVNRRKVNLHNWRSLGMLGAMPDEPKDVRLPLMVTRTEAAQIDEFRFTQRMPSRAEAIRRLIQLGLEAAKAAPDGAPKAE